MYLLTLCIKNDDLSKSVAAVDLLRIGMERGDNQTDIWTHEYILHPDFPANIS